MKLYCLNPWKSFSSQQYEDVYIIIFQLLRGNLFSKDSNNIASCKDSSEDGRFLFITHTEIQESFFLPWGKLDAEASGTFPFSLHNSLPFDTFKVGWGIRWCLCVYFCFREFNQLWCDHDFNIRWNGTLLEFFWT